MSGGGGGAVHYSGSGVGSGLEIPLSAPLCGVIGIPCDR